MLARLLARLHIHSQIARSLIHLQIARSTDLLLPPTKVDPRTAVHELGATFILESTGVVQKVMLNILQIVCTL